MATPMPATVAYSYLAPSQFSSGQAELDLQTSGGPSLHPHFFSGFLTAPAPTAAGLLALASVALARYDRIESRGWSRDPVVTACDDRLRFEAFSACNGVYARLDLLPAGLDGEIVSHGTTNVDINPPLRRALTRVRSADPMQLAVGPDDLTIRTFDGELVERKVPLPSRWLRGFTEAQVITSSFDLRAELTRVQATTFLNLLPKGAGRATLWALPAGRSLRLTAQPAPGAVCLAGAERLAALRPFLRHATSLRVYGPALTATSLPNSSTWELTTPAMRLSMTLSPDVSRSFSGEGAALTGLASDDAIADADLIEALLGWDPTIDVHDLAESAGLSPTRVRAALNVLATSGQVGYDVAEASYFHRVLPYDSAAAARLNPRLVRARALIEAGAVRIQTGGGQVHGSTGTHYLRKAGDDIMCTCAWWQQYRGGRGPCAHVLALQIATAASGAESERGCTGANSGFESASIPAGG